MRHDSNEILDSGDIGTLTRPAVAKAKKEKKVEKVTKKSIKPDFNRDFQRIINWVDRNILPYVALTLLSGLAYKGLMDFLPVMDQRAMTVVAVMGVSFLVVKLRAGKLQ